MLLSSATQAKLPYVSSRIARIAQSKVYNVFELFIPMQPMQDYQSAVSLDEIIVRETR